ncbi:thiamine-phosphate kinase [Rhodoluna sp. KAS3]|uniref:thiamine-phosphate kinase n=1 Tax=Rhodoluna sp. KAS3 TaxID=942880 RepID=UPI00222E5EA3|nr:thiamine-phosphate kinase [Rhodoluna sp. KAS3]BDS48750.1 thiamine-monophosphate kinase [Rhodoluna sp. KAS3]
MNTAETIGSLGENESLKRTISRLNASQHALVGPGDDSAVISAPDGRFVVTTDTMIEGHDFRLDWSTGYDLGWKAVASNIADVAAMGAVPTALVVAVSAPARTEIHWLESFADGLRDACERLAPGCGVVGGDLAASEQIMISVAAHGSLEGREPVLRSGAQVGDIVAVAGTLGRAAAGLALLQSANRDAISAYDALVDTQRRPQPPITSGVDAAVAGATSMLDLSDGLAKDAARIAKASGVTIQIDRLQLQGFEAVLEEAARAIEANEFDWVIGGGEDHSLLTTFPSDVVIPRAFKPIGVVLPVGHAPVMLGANPMPEYGWDSVRD